MWVCVCFFFTASTLLQYSRIIKACAPPLESHTYTIGVHVCILMLAELLYVLPRIQIAIVVFGGDANKPSALLN